MDSRQLTEEQQRAFDDITQLTGGLVFITGAGGTGKSHLTRALIKHYRDKHGPGHVVVSASTHAAAFHIRGSTLHRALGISANYDADAYLTKLEAKPKFKPPFSNAYVMFVDEISMIPAELFSLMAEALGARITTGSPYSGGSEWGNRLVIVCGDFAQLPPYGNAPWAFKSDAWEMTYGCELKQNQRAVDDSEFADALARFRRTGSLDPAAEKLLRERVERLPLTVQRFGSVLRRLKMGEPLPPDDADAVYRHVELMHRDRPEMYRAAAKVRSGVELDAAELRLFAGQMHPVSEHDPDIYYICPLHAECNRVNEQHMVNNKHKAMVFEAFDDDVSEFDNNVFDKHMRIMQKLDLKIGMVVVVLATYESRNTKLVRGARGVIKYFDRVMTTHVREDGTTTVYEMDAPMVKFPDSEEAVPVVPTVFEIRDAFGHVTATRTQVPLAIALATTAHFAQGMSAPGRVCVAIDRMFGANMAYVVISRVTKRQNLILRGTFDASKFYIDPEVVAFHDQLEQKQRAQAERPPRRLLDETSAPPQKRRREHEPSPEPRDNTAIDVDDMFNI